MKSRQQKEASLRLLVEKMEDRVFYIVDGQGLNSEQTQNLRAASHKADVHYQVVKNTQLRRALKQREKKEAELLRNDTTPIFKGSSALFIADKDQAKVPAKLIQDFCLQNQLKKPQLKAAIIDGEAYIGPQQLLTLSQLKSKQELVAEIISLLNAPMQHLMGTLKSSHHTLTGVVQTLSER
jgi:large subunit ribosomal protein L10